MNLEIVPFGKYKDQPIEVMLADQNYLEWITGQPGIMTMLQGKYPALFNIITVGAPQVHDTPEHNKLQAMFLDRAFQFAFIDAALTTAPDTDNWRRKRSIKSKTVHGISQEVAERAAEAKSSLLNELSASLQRRTPEAEKSLLQAQQKAATNDLFSKTQIPYLKKELAKLDALRLELTAFQGEAILPLEPDIHLDFECGFDISFIATWRNVGFFHRHGCYDVAEALTASSDAYREFKRQIELKPQMGDDFPSVLRQMKRNGADTLVTGAFNATGATLDQVRAMFGEKQIITLEQIRRQLSLCNQNSPQLMQATSPSQA